MSNKYFDKARAEARKATCKRARCGTVIVSADGLVIGKGHNAPPLEDEGQRTCNRKFNTNKKPKYDLTCCVHAEWNAILNASKLFPEKLEGSTLYFMRINDNDEFTDSGEPFCTVCSRLALQSGVSYFSLWHKGSELKYSTYDYNIASYNYHVQQIK